MTITQAKAEEMLAIWKEEITVTEKQIKRLNRVKGTEATVNELTDRVASLTKVISVMEAKLAC
jgi:hypothetical protein